MGGERAEQDQCDRPGFPARVLNGWIRALLAKEKAITDEVGKQLDAAIVEFQTQFK